jgi:hypothetical protein
VGERQTRAKAARTTFTLAWEEGEAPHLVGERQTRAKAARTTFTLALV